MFVASVVSLSLTTEAKNSLTYAKYIEVDKFLENLTANKDKFNLTFEATIGKTQSEAIDMLGGDIAKYFIQRFGPEVACAVRFMVGVQEVHKNRFYLSAGSVHGYNFPVKEYVNG